MSICDIKGISAVKLKINQQQTSRMHTKIIGATSLLDQDIT